MPRAGRIRAIALLAALASVTAAVAAPRPRAWTTGPQLPAARSEVAAATYGRSIAVLGGMTLTGDPTDDAWAYVPAANVWKPLPPLPEAVHHAAAAGDRGRVYLAGGYTSPGIATRLVAVLVPGADRWRALPPLPEPRAAAAAAVAGNRLYVVGGVGPEGLARTGYVLDLARARKWRSIPGPAPREHLAAAALGTAVYAIGGRRAGIDTNLSTVEWYDRRTATWRRGPSLPEPRGGAGAATAAGRIVSVGGEAPGTALAKAWALAPGKKARWAPLPKLPTARHGLGVAAVGDTLYTVAGGTRPGLSTSRVLELLRLR